MTADQMASRFINGIQFIVSIYGQKRQAVTQNIFLWNTKKDIGVLLLTIQ